MSVAATTWAWAQETRSSGQRLVLLALADHASHHDDEEGYTCWPKIARICEMTGLGRSTVILHINALADDGLLEKAERKVYGTRAGPTIYRMPVDETSKRSDGSDLKRSDGSDLKTSDGSDLIPTPEPLQGEPEERNGAALAVLGDWEIEFVDWWDMYPRKTSKPQALRAFRNARKVYPHQKVLGGMMAWKRHWEEAGTEEQFIPHPATFLNGHRFNDTPPKAEQKSDAMSLLRKVAERDHT